MMQTTWRATVVVAVVLAFGAAPAAADELDDLKRRAQELIEELEAELEAARAERKALEEERRRLEAAAPPPTTEEAPSETARKVDVLAEEVARIRDEIVVPPTTEYKSKYGLAPAASKVYGVSRGLSLGGYGEGFYSNTISDTSGTTDRADALRFVLYTGYKFTDDILLNAEIEFEHATSSSTVTSSDGSVSLEFAYLDFLSLFDQEWLNARGGLVLVPLGFINEMHEPTFFHGNNRPEVERRIIPTTWRSLGAGFFGEIGEEIEYRAYALQTLNAKGFSSSGIRGGRQKGNRTLAEDIGGAVRIDYLPSALEGLLVGGSAFVGNTTQDQRFDGSRSHSGLLSLWDLHAQFRWRGLHVRGLAAFGHLSDSKQISRDVGSPVARRFQGHYAEVAYDVMPHLFPNVEMQSLEPFFRYENFDTNESVGNQQGFGRDRTKDTELYSVGLGYKPHPQIVIKLDWRNFELARGERADDVNLGAGFIF